MIRSRNAHWLLPFVALFFLTAPFTVVWAQDDGNVGELGAGDRPWAEGVSIESQDKARELFQEANKLLLEQFFKQSSTKYREALEHWDHPAIHYNISLALLNLDRPLELHYHLGKALEHGVPPLLTEGNYQRAENYLSIVSKQIAIVEIACAQKGAKVTLDGKLLFTGPGAWKGPTLSGEHTVVATKKGYLADNKQLVLKPGKHTRIEMRMYTVEDLQIEERRFPQWVPWTIAGGGLIASGLGAFLHTRAKANYEDFDTEFSAVCANDLACNDSDFPEIESKLNTADLQQNMGVSLYFIGGAALATGLVMVFLNQPKITRKERPDANEGITVTFAPIISPETSGITASIRF